MPRRMPRVSSVGLSLLLMAAGLAFVNAGPQLLMNPWLSPDDLQLSNELRAVCSSSHTTSPEKVTSSACPPPCPATVNSNITQCLYYLKESHKEEVCGRDLGVERRREVLHGLRMRHCCEHAVDEALPEAAFRGGAPCRRMLDELLLMDNLAGQAACTHAELLSRYDCGQTYSIAHNCENCKEAYRRWVCSSLVPRMTRAGRRVRPCISVCQDVEQQCPYLIPGDWTNLTLPPGEISTHPTPQYAGEPTFLCLDLNIPVSGQQRVRFSYGGDEDCCYAHCGSPGRGGGSPMQLCEHCPGRPGSTDHDGNVTSSSSSSSPSIATRTFQQNTSAIVLLFAWTVMWIVTHSARGDHISDFLNCSLVTCAICVRTPLVWTKNSAKKCRSCS